MAETDIDRYYSEMMSRLSPQQLDAIESRARPEADFQPLPETFAESTLLKRTPSVKFPIADTYRDNIVQAASDREDALVNTRGQRDAYQGQSLKDMTEARGALEKFNEPSAAYAPNQEIEEGIRASKTASQAPIKTDRDMLSEAILSFGPGLLGAVTGESGQVAQLESGRTARGLFEARRKEAIDNAKAAKTAAEKRYTDLLNLKQKDRENFDKTQERELKRLETIVKTNVDFAKMSADQANKLSDQYQKADSESMKAREDAADKLAKLEMVPMQEKAKGERAKIMANIAQQKINQPTQSERESAGYLGMAQKAEQELNRIGGPDGSSFPSLKDPAFTAKVNIMSGEAYGSSALENLIKDPATRSQIQAEIDWAMTTLRDESGATIGQSEAIKQLNRYFPRYGDTPAIVAQKAAARAQKAAALKTSAGRAQIPEIEAPQGVQPKSSVKTYTPEDLKGMTYEQKLKAVEKMQADKKMGKQ